MGKVELPLARANEKGVRLDAVLAAGIGQRLSRSPGDVREAEDDLRRTISFVFSGF